jgi:hypothetical protein
VTAQAKAQEQLKPGCQNPAADREELQDAAFRVFRRVREKHGGANHLRQGKAESGHSARADLVVRPEQIQRGEVPVLDVGQRQTASEFSRPQSHEPRLHRESDHTEDRFRPQKFARIVGVGRCYFGGGISQNMPSAHGKPPAKFNCSLNELLEKVALDDFKFSQ